MIKTNASIILVLFVIIVAQSCKKEIFDVSESNGLNVPEGCEGVFYENAVKSIIEAKCATPVCHVVGTTAPGDYTQVGVVKSNISIINQRTVVDQTMPPTSSPQLNVDEIEMLRAWIDCGGQLRPSESGLVSFKNEINPIIQVNCAIPECHVAGFSSGDFTTSTDFEIKAKEGKVKQQVVISKTMPKIGSLRQSEIDLIDKWLSEGSIID